MTTALPAYTQDEALLRAYASAGWSVQGASGPLEVALGAAKPDRQLRPSGIVTAYNPASVPRTAEENEAADADLLRHVRALGVPFRRAVASGPGPNGAEWEEPGYCLLGDVRPLLVELGLVFGQNAVVWVDADGDVSLVCTRAGFAGRRPGQKIEF